MIRLLSDEETILLVILVTLLIICCFWFTVTFVICYFVENSRTNLENNRESANFEQRLSRMVSQQQMIDSSRSVPQTINIVIQDSKASRKKKSKIKGFPTANFGSSDSDSEIQKPVKPRKPLRTRKIRNQSKEPKKGRFSWNRKRRRNGTVLKGNEDFDPVEVDGTFQSKRKQLNRYNTNISFNKVEDNKSMEDFFGSDTSSKVQADADKFNRPSG